MSLNNVYILLHGAWHASWCWKYVTPLLQQAGHTVIEHDFLGHGKNPHDFVRINLKKYVDELIHLISTQTKPVILVAHSFAGVMASQVAEKIPDKIQKIIYIAAYVPENNSALLLEAKHSILNIDKLLTPDVQNNQMRCDVSDPSILKKAFYNKCDEDDFNFALKNLQVEPLLPMGQTIKISKENFGRVDKLYIACLEDAGIDIDNQLRMANNANIKNIIKLASDHSPFFSMPNELVEAIL